MSYSKGATMSCLAVFEIPNAARSISWNDVVPSAPAKKTKWSFARTFCRRLVSLRYVRITTIAGVIRKKAGTEGAINTPHK